MRTEKVDRWLVAKCIDAKDIPALPATAAQANGDFEQDAAAASADARDYKRVARSAIIALQKCAKDQEALPSPPKEPHP